MSKNTIYESFQDVSKKIFAESNKNIKGNIPPHFHRCIEIIYLTNGKCTCEITNENINAERDDILFFKRCEVHSLNYNNTDSIVLVITPKYSKDFETIFQNKTISCLLNDKEFNKSLLPYFNVLANNNENSDMVIKGFVNVIIGKLFEHYPNNKIEHPANIDVIISVLNYIDDHYKEPITLDVISKKFGYNKYYFSRLFNLTIGENLNNYINGVRLRNLINEASKTEKPNLSKMLLDYGFDSFSTFYRACYKAYNMPPKKLIEHV